MRSTVDILDVLDRELREKAARLGLSFKDALNRVIAAGLSALDVQPPRKRRFRVKAKECGLQPGIDPLHLNRLAAELEDESRLKRKA
jgi:hypothetical protein